MSTNDLRNFMPKLQGIILDGGRSCPKGCLIQCNLTPTMTHGQERAYLSLSYRKTSKAEIGRVKHLAAIFAKDIHVNTIFFPSHVKSRARRLRNKCKLSNKRRLCGQVARDHSGMGIDSQ